MAEEMHDGFPEVCQRCKANPPVQCHPETITSTAGAPCRWRRLPETGGAREMLGVVEGELLLYSELPKC